MTPHRRQPRLGDDQGATRTAKASAPAQWAGLLLMASLFLSLVGTRWASYLPSPLPGVFLPDFLLGAAVLLAVGAFAQSLTNRAVLASIAFAVPAGLYVAYRVAETRGSATGLTWLWIRDMAPFLYALTIPVLMIPAGTVSYRRLLTVVRAASVGMAVVVVGNLTGLLQPFNIGTPVPVFSTRPDVDNVVLGIGVLAFGRWDGVARPHRWLQVTMLFLAAANYSRAGALAAFFCVFVALIRERRALVQPKFIGLACVATAVPLLGWLFWAISTDMRGVGLPGAVQRLIDSDLGSGTTRGRLRAWHILWDYTALQGNLLAGAGPGTNPLRDSGALRYLSGAEGVRAPHSWFIGALIYHGILGAVAWSLLYVRLFQRRYRSGSALLPTTAVAAYLISASFGVVVESPFGALPIAAFSAWALIHGRAGASIGVAPYAGASSSPYSFSKDSTHTSAV